MADEPLIELPVSPWAATFRSLRHRNYRLFFFGQLVSLIGTWMQTTVLMWLAFDLTQTSFWPSMISAGQLLPTFLLGLWGGSIADRWPKRPVLLVTQFGQLVLAALLAVLVWLGHVEPWQLLAITLATGSVVAIDVPVRLAFVLDMVSSDRADLMNAVALNSVLFNAARAVGPYLGVLVMSWFGPAACFGFNALSYVAVLAALLCIDVSGGPIPSAEHDGLRTLAQGFVALAARPRILILVVAGGLTALCGWPALTLLPALASGVLNHAERGYGQLLSATGAGALTAGLVVATFGKAVQPRLFIVGGIALVSAGILGLAATEDYWLAMLCCALIGFGLISFFAIGQSVLQLTGEPSLRGRLLGIWVMVLSGAAPLGNLVVGKAADRWGVAPVLQAEGLALGATALTLLVLGSLRPRISDDAKAAIAKSS